MVKQVVYFIFLVTLLSCGKTDNSISFYHWKANADFLPSYEKAIKTTNTQKIYLHYFDVKTDENNRNYFPTYVLNKVASQYDQFEITPVIYITNNVLQSEQLVVADLAEKIKKLVHQISKKHFKKEIKNLQIDCDWTLSTKNTYFELLETLNPDFNIDVTIRLHQIKFKEKTGIPPVKTGTLMLYNIGDLKNKNQNSILENAIVQQYINNETSYNLPLKIALPLFSQTIAFNNTNKIKIIKDAPRKVLENDTHFKQVNNTNFEVVKDTLYKGFYLSKGYHLKLEELSEKEIIDSYKTIKKSKLVTNEVIFYHLDESSLSSIDLKTILEKL